MNRDQFKKLSGNQNAEPFVMLNLLKFRPHGGAKLYARYMKETARFLDDVGGKVIYLGKTGELLNGEETWDVMMLVEYPSRRAFLTMANNPEYIKIHAYREEALERAVLYSTDRIDFRDIAQWQE